MSGQELAAGDGVVYRPYLGAKGEDGTVVRWNDSHTLVFVLFVGDRTAKACSPTQLERLTCREHFAAHPTRPELVAVCTLPSGHQGEHDNVLPKPTGVVS